MKYFLALIPGILACIGNYFGDYFLWFNLGYLLLLAPITEWFQIENKVNRPNLANPILADFVLVLTVIVNTVSIFLMLRAFYIHPDMNLLLMVLYAANTGFNASSIGITVAHELIHRKQFGYRALGIWNLFLVSYGHFYVEHIKGHHRYVGTPLDPATSKKNETIYAFFLRTITGQFKSALNIEANRLRKEKKSAFGLSNFVVTITILEIIFMASLSFFINWKAGIGFFISSYIAIIILEYINYIEHYGLERGGNEKFGAVHAWQSDNIISRNTLVELSRHSDHHMKASKPYYTLETHEESPVLPAGYFGVLYLAFIPPLWFKVVNPKLEAFQAKQLSVK
jgi:alkane 1-monooxygenase